MDFAAVAWLGVAEAGEGVDQWPAWACSAAGQALRGLPERSVITTKKECQGSLPVRANP